MINIDLWLHSEHEDFMDILTSAGLDDAARDTFGNPIYEVQVNVDVDPDTGEHRIQFFEVGGKKYVEAT